MFKKLGSLFALLLGLALLIYSATRSLDFISMTLPPEKQVLAWFGLAALDGGLLAWLAAYLYGAKGGWQRAVSLIMVVIDFLGCVAMFTADTLYRTGQTGMTTTLDQQTIFGIVIGLSLVIAANIASTVVFELTNPEALKRQADEEAQGEIEDLARKMVSDQAKSLSAVIAPQIAAAWKDEMEANYRNLLTSRRKKTEITVSEVQPPRLPTTNKLPTLPEGEADEPQSDPTQTHPRRTPRSA